MSICHFKVNKVSTSSGLFPFMGFSVFNITVASQEGRRFGELWV